MIIRCEQCSTTYELDEGLLDAEGSEVECSRCHHLFTVRPPKAVGRTLVGVPPVEPPPPSPPRPERPAQRAEPPSAPAPAARPAGRTTPPGRGPSVYRPAGAPPSSVPAVARASLLRRDTVGAFESRLRWSHRWRWLAPALLAAVVVAGALVWFLRRPNPGAAAGKAHTHALELALRDDAASLEEAGADLDRALRAAPGLRAARADRALMDLLLAGALAEGARSPEQQERTRGLLAHATEALDQLDREGAAPAEVARARAVAAALGQDRATVARLAAAARAKLPDDPQVELAERGAEVRAADRGVRDRAVGALGMLVARRPELVRARYLLARGQGLAGRRAEALATLDGLLRANPRHEGAAALRAELVASAKPAPALPAAEVGAAPPPVVVPSPAKEERALTLPRKQGAPAEAAVAGGGQPGASAAAPAARPLAARPPPPAAAPAPAPSPAAASAGAAAEGADRPVADPDSTSPPTRLRPAAVPEPEPVQGGG